MRIVLINLGRAVERRRRMERELDSVTLPCEAKEAIDGWPLSASDLAPVDWEVRRRLGLGGRDDGSVGRWPTHRDVIPSREIHEYSLLACSAPDQT